MNQLSNKVLMVRPVKFGFNPETSVNNKFQVGGEQEGVEARALKEFDSFVELLREAGVEVVVIEDTLEPHTPDSIFPNNWFSVHQCGALVLYPMFAPNRRLERKEAPMSYLKSLPGLKRVVDLTDWEEKGLFLEGTGSMIFDREAGVVYACRSARTAEEVLEQFVEALEWDYFLFDAFDEEGNPIYHTNVMMEVGDKYAIVCLDAISDLEERVRLIELLEERDKEVIEISLEQMGEFAGNMIELKSGDGESLLVMSKRAYDSLDSDQVEKLQSYSKIIAPDLTTIEVNGGGSARCMIAELFL